MINGKRAVCLILIAKEVEDDEWILHLFAETAAAVLEEEPVEPPLTYDLPN